MTSLYAYVRNRPTILTDPTGLVDNGDFNCSEHVCHSQDGGLSDHGDPDNESGVSGLIPHVPRRDATPEGYHRCGVWCGLGQRIRNGFTGHGFKTNEQLLPKGTVTTTETYYIHEPNPYVTAATDVAGLVAPVAGKTGKLLGPVTSAISLRNDRSPTNVVLNVVPLVIEDTALPLAALGAEADLLGATAQYVEEGMINAIPGEKIDDGYGHTIPNPAFSEQNMCQDLGCQ